MSILSYLTWYRLSLQWQLWVLTNVRKRAVARARDTLLSVLDGAMALIREAMRLEYKYKADKRGSGKAAVDLDRQIDGLVALLFNTLTGVGRCEGSIATAGEARALVVQAFPAGLNAHVHGTFINQSAANLMLLSILQDPAYKVVLEQAGLTAVLRQLEELVPRFEDLIAPGEPVTWDQLSAATDRAEQETQRALFLALGTFSTTVPADVTDRDYIAAPLREAKSQIHAHFVARQKKEAQTCEEGKDGAAGKVKKETGKKEVTKEVAGGAGGAPAGGAATPAPAQTEPVEITDEAPTTPIDATEVPAPVHDMDLEAL